MPKANPLIAALNAGEFSPKMAARVDFSKYPQAAEHLENFIPLPEGGIARRPGSRHVMTVKDQAAKTRIGEFQFSDEQAYPLEFGNQYIRFFRNQGQIVVVATDAAITNGTFASDISGWTDSSTGSAAIAWNAGGWMDLVGASSETAIAEQAPTATTGLNVENVLTFDVVNAVQGDSVKVRIGTASGGEQILADTEFLTGFHTVAFTPTASPFYIQFRNERAKTVGIDNVSILDDEPVELKTPYLTAGLFDLKGDADSDVSYIANGNKPYKLARMGHTSWSLIQVDFKDGPYLDANADTAKTLTMSATTGLGITITAAGAGNTPFASTDVGRLVRQRSAANVDYGYAVITAFSSSTSVTADVRRDFSTTLAQSDWALGAWSDTTGYPTDFVLHEQRLVAARSTLQPKAFWGSQSADLENMRPDSFVSSAIQVEDDDAIVYTLAKADPIRWLETGDFLFIGTSGGEWTVGSTGPVLTPSDVDAKRRTTHGSANVDPVAVSNVVLFLSKSARKLREMSFIFELDTYRAPSLMRLANHVSKTGIVEMAHQEEPESVIWCARTDGQLAALTYLREDDVVGWARHVLGGSFGTGDAVVESVAVVPGSVTAGSEERDEVWLIVKRTINGATTRYIEFFEKAFEGPERGNFTTEAAYDAQVLLEQKDAFYVDSGLSATFGAATTAVSGLTHLEGETVGVWADGAIQADKVVASGAITLDVAATTVVVGLRYEHKYKSLKLAAGAAAGTAVGATKHIHQVVLILLHSLGGRIGTNEAHLEDLVFREVSDAMDTGVPLFTGEMEVGPPTEHELDPRFFVVGDDPCPFTLLGWVPKMDTQDTI